jgi:CRP-like cAMP-binding protein
MPVIPAASNLIANRLLAALPRDEYERILPSLEPFGLKQRETLYYPGDTIRYAYFPKGGMVSLLSLTERGETIEVAVVGHEGFIGVPVVLGADATPFQSVVQLPGDAVRMRADALRRAAERGGRFRELLLGYSHTLLAQVTQSAVCNRFHTVEQRLCRWLLTTGDRARADTFELTQEFISQMLGTPRTAVTMVAVSLQDAGLIRYRRGKITILNRQRLEAAACECYRVVRVQSRQFAA